MRNIPSRLAAVALVCRCWAAVRACSAALPRPSNRSWQWPRRESPPKRSSGSCRRPRAVYPLTASQIVKLHEQGVPEAVLDYMQNAYADNIRWEARMQYEGRYWWHDCFYCYQRPVIVVPR